MEENNFNQNQNNPTEDQPTSEVPQQPSEPQQEEAPTKSVGPIIGIAIILIVLIFGGLYYWGGKISNQELRNQQESITAEEILDQQDESLESLQVQSTSDEIVEIEADLDLTNLEGLDKELDNIDVELSL